MTRGLGRAFRAAAIAALALFPAVGRAAPTLEVDVPPASVHVGDRVQVTLTLTAPEALGGEPRFPAWGKSWGDVEIVSAGSVENAGSGVYRQSLVLVPFSTGDVALPPQAVEVALTSGTIHLQTPPAALHVASLLPPKDSKAETRPPAPPQDLPIGERFWWTLAAAEQRWEAPLGAAKPRSRRSPSSSASSTPWRPSVQRS